MSGNKFETTATECSKWEEWLHDAVDEASDVADKLDWSTEQVLAYAILQGRSQAYEEAIATVEALLPAYVRNDPERQGVVWAIDTIRSKANQ